MRNTLSSWRQDVSEKIDAREEMEGHKSTLRSYQRSRWLQKRNHSAYAAARAHRERMALIRMWFDFLDADGSGEISVDELEEPMLAMGFVKSRDDLMDLIAAVDVDGQAKTFGKVWNHPQLPRPGKSQRES